jgi:hypothetical protein
MSLPPDSRILQLQVSAPLVKMHSLWKPIKDIFLHSITFLISSKNVSHYQINIQTTPNLISTLSFWHVILYVFIFLAVRLSSLLQIIFSWQGAYAKAMCET